MIFEKQILAMYKGMAFTRCDDTGRVFYFTAKDFDSLKEEPYPFKSSKGHTLEGKIYSYENPIPRRLVIFDHGFGGGHTAYMKEIEMLCRKGYRVFAYDHTGCMASGGETTGGMAQSLADLDDCLTALKKDPLFADTDFSVVGHSWGGFSALNIAALHPEISHMGAISGFVSVKLLVESYFGGILKGYRKVIMSLEKEANPKYVGYHAVETLKNSKVKALLIYSEDDKMCKKAPHYDTLWEGLKDKENVRFLLVKNKGHNPNFTEDAVRYKDSFFADLTKKTKKKRLETKEAKKAFIASYDWERMTAQDEAVWQEIYHALES